MALSIQSLSTLRPAARGPAGSGLPARTPGRGIATHAPSRARGSLGLTLIELLVVLAVMGVLAAFAVPTFVTMIQNNRVANEVNGFVGDLQFARSEAIKEGQPVTICTSTDGATCLGSTNWQSGWIVFANPTGATSPTSAAMVLRRQKTWTSTDTFVASNSVSAFTYSRDGFAVGAAGIITMTLHTTPANSTATRCVAVNLVGRQQVQTVNGTNCL